jgi:uncharacterized protein YprB with RNaseH-like and TPR domain
MGIKAKLAQLQTQSGCHHPAPTSPKDSDLHRRLDQVQRKRIQAASSSNQITCQALAQQLKGHEISDGVIELQQRYSLHRQFGHHKLSLLDYSLQLPEEVGEPHKRQVYIDTETTGLSGGSGTLAFLIGLAVVEHDALVVTQYLLTRFVGEAAMLTSFAQMLKYDDRLVSYNGKCFDLPLLITRYRMQGKAHHLETLAHLDLLHPVRRLYAKCWPDCRLQTLEQRLLGLQRCHDLPGAEAPGAWADYLRYGKADKLVRVVEHNRQDLLSLALAHAVLVRAMEQPERYKVDLVGLAQWLSKSNPQAAYRLLNTTHQPLDDRGKRLLGVLAKRLGDWTLAVGIWEALSYQGCHKALEELAKYHEHVSRNLTMAQYYCKQLPPGTDQARRLARIEIKLQRQTQAYSIRR